MVRRRLCGLGILRAVGHPVAMAEEHLRPPGFLMSVASFILAKMVLPNSWSGSKPKKAIGARSIGVLYRLFWVEVDGTGLGWFYSIDQGHPFS